MCYCTIVSEAAIAVFVVEYVAEEPTVAAKPDETARQRLHARTVLYVRKQLLAAERMVL